MRNKYRIAGVVTAALVFAGIAVFMVADRAAARKNIIIVVVDALRRDHLSVYGYGRNTTPVLDAIAHDGLLFENAVSQAPNTYSSVPSIMSSQYPSQLSRTGLDSIRTKTERVKKLQRVSDDVVMLAEVLKDNGYNTWCVTTNPYVSKRFGVLQGFDESVYAAYMKADKVIEKGIGWIDGWSGMNDAPFFLYLHVMDVHTPTDPPSPYDTMYPTIDSGANVERYHTWEYEDGEGLDTNDFAVFRSNKISLYDGAVSFVDAQIGRLIDHLKAGGLYQNTVIVIAADHGDELWDHAVFEKEYLEGSLERIGTAHGHTLFSELTNVPLIFAGAGIPAGRVQAQVRNLDIMPSILGIAGVVPAGLAMQGEDIIKEYKEGVLVDLLAVSEIIVENTPVSSIQDGRYKYIKHGDKEFFFDKTDRPYESKDLSRVRPGDMAMLKGALADIEKGIKRPSGKIVAIDEKTESELRTLGYVQ